MKNFCRFFILILFMFFCAASAWSIPDFKAMLKELDNMGNFEDTDFSCVYTIVSEKPGEEQEVMQTRMFRRDSKDLFVLLILKPEVKRGQGYLQIDENMWFYDPESRKFSHSSIKENIQNSEAKNSDFNSNSLAEDYDVVNWKEGKLGSFPVYILELKANNNEVSYSKRKLWVRKDKTLILKAEDYSLSDRLMRISYFPKYVQVGKKLTPSQILIVDKLNEGEKTQISMKNTSVSKLPDSVFTKAYLEKVNR